MKKTELMDQKEKIVFWRKGNSEAKFAFEKNEVPGAVIVAQENIIARVII